MKLSNLFGTDIKERIKKLMFRYKNRNFSPYVVDRVMYGTDFKFFVANKDGKSWYIDSSDESMQKHGFWLCPELEFVKNSICSQGDIVLECGGHHGLTAVVISKWIGQAGRVYCFEPNPENLPIINKNIEINDIHNVVVIPKAVGAADGKIKITNSDSNSYILKGSENNGVEVAVVRVDDYLNLKPTMLKIDVEGFEVEVLKGAKELLKTHPKLAIELHPDMIQRYKSSVEELLSLIDADYNLFVQWGIYETAVPYDRKTPITHRAHLFAMPA